MITASGVINVRSGEGLTALMGRFTRIYLCLSDGTWAKVAKADVRKYLSDKHRHEQHYVVAEEHEPRVGWAAYVQPIRKFDWETNDAVHGVWLGRSEAGFAYRVVQVERHGAEPVFVVHVDLGQGFIFVCQSDTLGEAKEAAMIDYADRKRGVK